MHFFCHYPFSIFFLAPLLPFFSALLLSLPFALHILCGCNKNLGLNYGLSLEIGPRSIIGVVDHFSTIFAPKLITLFCNLLRQGVIDIQNRPLYGKVHPSSTICLSRISGDISLMTSQVVQRARELWMYPAGPSSSQGVKTLSQTTSFITF